MSDIELKGHEFIGEGRHRKVFRKGNVVVKIPCGIWIDGALSNEREYKIYSQWKESGKDTVPAYARCRLLKNGWLVMEYVEHIPPSLRPAWSGYIDCGQVGTTFNSNVVAYDFGY